MFGLSLKFTKKIVEGCGFAPDPTGTGELTTHPRTPYRIEPLGASIQRRHSKGTPSNAKCVTEILGETK